MVDKLAYFNLKETSFDMDELTIIRNISVQIVDMRDDAIVEACIDFAKQAGIHDLILLDKKFVLDALREKIQGKTIDAVHVVRCKDCANYKKRHVLTADGEEKSYEEMPPEAFGGLDDMYVTMEYGINVGGKCMLDEGRGYPVDKSVFRSPNDYCSYGVRMDGDPHDDSGQ